MSTMKPENAGKCDKKKEEINQKNFLHIQRKSVETTEKKRRDIPVAAFTNRTARSAVRCQARQTECMPPWCCELLP